MTVLKKKEKKKFFLFWFGIIFLLIIFFLFFLVTYHKKKEIEIKKPIAKTEKGSGMRATCPQDLCEEGKQEKIIPEQNSLLEEDGKLATDESAIEEVVSKPLSDYNSFSLDVKRQFEEKNQEEKISILESYAREIIGLVEQAEEEGEEGDLQKLITQVKKTECFRLLQSLDLRGLPKEKLNIAAEDIYFGWVTEKGKCCEAFKKTAYRDYVRLDILANGNCLLNCIVFMLNGKKNDPVLVLQLKLIMAVEIITSIEEYFLLSGNETTKEVINIIVERLKESRILLDKEELLSDDIKYLFRSLKRNIVIARLSSEGDKVDFEDRSTIYTGLKKFFEYQESWIVLLDGFGHFSLLVEPWVHPEVIELKKEIETILSKDGGCAEEECKNIGDKIEGAYIEREDLSKLKLFVRDYSCKGRDISNLGKKRRIDWFICQKAASIGWQEGILSWIEGGSREEGCVFREDDWSFSEYDSSFCENYIEPVDE